MNLDIDWLTEQFPLLNRIEPLAQGGQKIVFSCEHSNHGACVLKLIRPGSEQRLGRELEAYRRLIKSRRINMPQIYQVGIVDTRVGQLIWLLENYIDGISLTDVLQNGPLGRDRILALALDLLSAVADGEAMNIVHRDIKPDNVKIDSNGRAWLLDFGIARILDLDSITRTDAISGPHSPGYSAPEQFRYRKRHITCRADLFAIGVVLYECATGTNPFLAGARDRLEVLNRVERDPLAYLDLNWDTERLFADFIASLTQKYPHQRPSSCAEALEWLQEIVTELGGLT